MIYYHVQMGLVDSALLILGLHHCHLRGEHYNVHVEYDLYIKISVYCGNTFYIFHFHCFHIL